MNVNGVGGSPQSFGTDPSAYQSRVDQALGPVAKLFNESVSQLENELHSSNTSLSALAQTKGISETDLENAIKQGLQQSSPNGTSPLSDTQLTNIAQRIATRVHGGHHHHRARPTDPTTATTPTNGVSNTGATNITF